MCFGLLKVLSAVYICHRYSCQGKSDLWCFPFLITSQPDQLVCKCINLKEKFYPSPLNFFKIAHQFLRDYNNVFFKILQLHDPFKLMHSFHRLAILAKGKHS